MKASPPPKDAAPAPPPFANSPWSGGREQRRESKRQAVLQAAAQLFNERGFHATSLDDVAARLHVSKPTLYYYVSSKDEILQQCVNLGLQMALDGIEESRAMGGSSIDQLVAYMKAYGRTMTMDFGMCVIRVGEEGLSGEGRKALRRSKGMVDMEFRRLVAQCVQEGSLAPCDPKLAAFTIAGALSWIGRWYQPDGEHTAEQVIEQTVGILLKGVLNGASEQTGKQPPSKRP
jgi:AcrR family transcriptional regulator